MRGAIVTLLRALLTAMVSGSLIGDHVECRYNKDQNGGPPRARILYAVSYIREQLKGRVAFIPPKTCRTLYYWSNAGIHLCNRDEWSPVYMPYEYIADGAHLIANSCWDEKLDAVSGLIYPGHKKWIT
ncbi:hypothetical protein BDW62DRAFT_198387 [Aspergillus aurantiobrunneus]